VAHAMSVIAVRAGVARMVIDTDPGQAREALIIIETTTRRSLREMRLLVSVLRSAEDHHAGTLWVVQSIGDLAQHGVLRRGNPSSRHRRILWRAPLAGCQ